METSPGKAAINLKGKSDLEILHARELRLVLLNHFSEAAPNTAQEELGRGDLCGWLPFVRRLPHRILETRAQELLSIPGGSEMLR